MKISGAKKVHYESGPNMTPLVDIVMVILIFLMLAGSFGGTARFLESSQGIHSGVGKAAPLKPGEVPDVDINVNVDNSHDGVGFMAQVENTATGDAEKLRGLLEAKRQAMISIGKTSDQLQVVLRPGRRVKYRFLIAVYQAAMQAGYKKIAFAKSH